MIDDRLSRRRLLAGVAALPLASGCVTRVVTGATSGKYGRHPGENPEFADALDLYLAVLPTSVRTANHGGTQAPSGDACATTDVVTEAICALAAAIGTQSTAWGPALNNVGSEAPVVVGAEQHGKLVVFSDHHLGSARQRHNVFSGPGGTHYRTSNHRLYEAVLRQYLSGGYTLVENGDVEDTVIFDPAQYPGEYAQRLRDYQGNLANLESRRLSFREGVLADTLADPVNAEYYRLLAEFGAADRLFRTAGNHDYQRRVLWRDAATSAKRRVPSLVLPTEEVQISSLIVSRGGAWESIVMHGHPFDRVSGPQRASLHGETISECLGVWYQGSDRIWPWDEWVAQWAHGAPFRNVLVSGTRASGGAIEALARDDSRASYPAWEEAQRRLWGRVLLGVGTFEDIYQHPVGWEYLTPHGEAGLEDPLSLAFRAAVEGEAWFKLRHTEELELADRLPALLAAQGKSPPLLVLGHTHEPRFGALDTLGRPVDWYLNAGAAGRFEGLIWAVEIHDGEPRMVSWHPEPFPDGPPVRRVWTPSGPFRELLASRVADLPC